jgi:hypothetical protein
MKTLVTVYQPYQILVDTTDCNTLQDLTKALNKADPGLIDPKDDTVYSAGTFDLQNGMKDGVALGGEGYSPLSAMPTIHNARLDLVGIPRPSFKVWIIWNRGDLMVDHEMTVDARDQVVNVKKRVQEQLGFPADSQIVHHDGQELEDSDHLFALNVVEEDIITITFKAKITFKYNHNQVSKVVDSTSDTKLFRLLLDFANEEGVDVYSLRFAFYEPSGVVQEIALDWLFERTDMFQANEVYGTVQENGLKDGDMIFVFGMNKRKFEDDDDAEDAEDKDDAEEKDGAEDKDGVKGEDTANGQRGDEVGVGDGPEKQEDDTKEDDTKEDGDGDGDGNKGHDMAEGVADEVQPRID